MALQIGAFFQIHVEPPIPEVVVFLRGRHRQCRAVRIGW
jgi:hypothetical protein